MKNPDNLKLVPEEVTPKMERLIAEVEQEIKEGKVSRAFDNVDDFLADLKR